MTARITYRTSSSNPSAPKVDGKAISLKSVIDGANADSYEHSFYFELTDQNIETSKFEVILGTDWDNSFGGICGYNGGSIVSCHVSNETSLTGDANGNSNGFYIGGITGVNDGGGVIDSSYVQNSNLTTGSDSKIGGLVGESQSANIVSSYFYKDEAHIITKGDNCKFGYIGGKVWNYCVVYDCFYNQTDESHYGDEGYISSDNVYNGIKSYDDFTTDSGNPRAWSDDAWSAYTINATNWPPVLNQN